MSRLISEIVAMNKFSILAFCNVALITMLPLSAQAETLSESVLSALENHPTLEAAIAARDAASENQEEQLAGYYPRIKVNAGTGRVYGDNSTSRGLSVTRGSGYSWQSEGGITLTQMLFDGFKVGHKVDAAQARTMAADNDIESVREDLSFRTVVAYLTVMKAIEERKLITEYTDKINSYISRIDTMVENGASHEAERQQAKNLLLALKRMMYENERSLEIARINYNELTGHFPEGAMSAPPLSYKFLQNEDAEISRAVAEHPALKIASYRADAAGNEVEVEKGSLYPELNAELSYYKKDLDDLIGGEVVDAKSMVRLSWNFSTGGEQLKRISKKRYEHAGYLARINEKSRQIERDIRIAYASMNAAEKQMEVSKQGAALQSTLVKIYASQFEGGSVSLLQLLQAENQLFMSSMEELAAKYELISSQHNVLAKMGRLNTVLLPHPVSENLRPAENVEKQDIKDGAG